MFNASQQRVAARLIAVVAGTLILNGCSALTRLAEVGETPKLSTIQDPTHSPNYRPVSMPMPAPAAPSTHANSLWRTGSRAFFKDQRASNVGDIVTVLITIDDKAEISNTTERSRNNTDDASVNALLGYESSLNRILPEAINPGNLIDIDSQTSNSGAGSVNRDEEIELKVAAVVSQILPNGNMVIHGRQEVRVNFEVRELQIAGVVRPEDITAANTISHEKIAEARIAYGGRGQITDFQQPRYGQQILDIIMPF